MKTGRINRRQVIIESEDSLGYDVSLLEPPSMMIPGREDPLEFGEVTWVPRFLVTDIGTEEDE